MLTAASSLSFYILLVIEIKSSSTLKHICMVNNRCVLGVGLKHVLPLIISLGV